MEGKMKQQLILLINFMEKSHNSGKKGHFSQLRLRFLCRAFKIR